MGNKYSKLIKNTTIFAIGTFGSKILSFLIIPLYTYYLSTSEYGNIDLFTTSINLLVPFVTLMIQEACIRFMVTKEIPQKTILNNCLLTFFLGCVITISLIPVYSKMFSNKWMVVSFVFLLSITSYNTIFSQYLRGCNKNVAFSINGIIVTFVTVFSNLLLIVRYSLGVQGYIISLILAQAIASVQATICGKVLENICFKCIDLNSLKKMLAYSLPLVPSNLMWWIMNAGDKYVINYYLGDSSNGIYSIAMKIPTVLSLMYTIFMQAWQLSALDELNSDARSEFYDQVFSYTSALLLLGTSIIIALAEPLFSLVFNPEYYTAWKYIPLLCIATLINCAASFFGITYTINKNSKKSLVTTLFGAVSNLVFNFILIKTYGLFGVVIGTIIGYAVVLYMRALDAHRQLKMSFTIKKTFPSFLLVIIQASIVSVIGDSTNVIAIKIVPIVLIVFIYHKDIKAIIKKLQKKC